MGQGRLTRNVNFWLSLHGRCQTPLSPSGSFYFCFRLTAFKREWRSASHPPVTMETRPQTEILVTPIRFVCCGCFEGRAKPILEDWTSVLGNTRVASERLLFMSVSEDSPIGPG